MTKILLIDDADDLALLVKHSLAPYFVHQARTIAEAELALKDIEYDLILIDVTLPDGNGFDFCTRLNHDVRLKKMPRMMLTGRADVAEKVYGFSCGADDYLTKPFSPQELRARTDRFLARQSTQQETIFAFSCFVFDLEFQKCYVVNGENKTDLVLTPTEFRLLLTLAKSEGRVLTRKFLEMTGWESQGSVIEIRGIDTHIAHLRKKLGPLKEMIVSVYGQGYSLQIKTA